MNHIMIYPQNFVKWVSSEERLLASRVAELEGNWKRSPPSQFRTSSVHSRGENRIVAAKVWQIPSLRDSKFQTGFPSDSTLFWWSFSLRCADNSCQTRLQRPRHRLSRTKCVHVTNIMRNADTTARRSSTSRKSVMNRGYSHTAWQMISGGKRYP